MNIKRVPQEEMKSLNFEELHEWRIKNESVLMFRSERHDVLEAKQKELKNWIDHDVYEEVEDKGQNCISVTWVITEKTSDGKQIVKARLVARGYEEEDKDSLRTDSPTISKDNLRPIFAITSSLKAKFGARSGQVHQIRGKTWEVLSPQDAKVGKKSQFLHIIGKFVISISRLLFYREIPLIETSI